MPLLDIEPSGISEFLMTFPVAGFQVVRHNPILGWQLIAGLLKSFHVDEAQATIDRPVRQSKLSILTVACRVLGCDW